MQVISKATANDNVADLLCFRQHLRRKPLPRLLSFLGMDRQAMWTG